MTSRQSRGWWIGVGLVLAGCSADDASPAAERGSEPRAGAAASVAGGSGTGGVAGEPSRANGAAGSGLIVPVTPAADGGGVDRDADGGAVCARQEAAAALEPIYLAFAFDVSGSMGKGDKAWHDRSLKWEPVVRATRGFLEDSASQGLSASMTFFPADGGDDTRCELDSYRQADVAMRALPSTEFGAALDVIGMEDWRGGTPTLYVLQGIFEQIRAAEQTMPGRYAIVLVTDGYPQDCDDDSITSVAELVRGHASEVPTYVIGVANPPIDDAPDVTTNLADVAAAGGTGDAHLIDTGDPDKTTRDFTATIEAIRRASLSCNLDIPMPPSGETFDKTKVRVTYTSAGRARELRYASDCAGDDAWHYDDPASPRQIVLCPQTCDVVQAEESAKLNVAFECEQVIVVPL